VVSLLLGSRPARLPQSAGCAGIVDLPERLACFGLCLVAADASAPSPKMPSSSAAQALLLVRSARAY